MCLFLGHFHRLLFCTQLHPNSPVWQPASSPRSLENQNPFVFLAHLLLALALTVPSFVSLPAVSGCYCCVLCQWFCSIVCALKTVCRNETMNFVRSDYVRRFTLITDHWSNEKRSACSHLSTRQTINTFRSVVSFFVAANTQCTQCKNRGPDSIVTRSTRTPACT